MMLITPIQNSSIYASIVPGIGAICVKYLCDDKYKIVSPSIWRIWQTQITPNHSLVRAIFSSILPALCAVPLTSASSPVVTAIRVVVDKMPLSKIIALMSMGGIALSGKTLFDNIESQVGKLAILGAYACLGELYADVVPLKTADFWSKFPPIKLLTYFGLSLYLRKVCFEKGVHPVYTELFFATVDGGTDWINFLTKLWVKKLG